MGAAAGNKLGIKPFFCTWLLLSTAMQGFHLNEKRWVDGLHDVWMQGAPSPSSYVRDAAHFDERVTKPQVGMVARLVLPSQLAAWIVEVAAARGAPVEKEQVMQLMKAIT
jgi:hypothetical protein